MSGKPSHQKLVPISQNNFDQIKEENKLCDHSKLSCLLLMIRPQSMQSMQREKHKWNSFPPQSKSNPFLLRKAPYQIYSKNMSARWLCNKGTFPKPNDLSLISKTFTGKRKNQVPQVALWPPHVNNGTCLLCTCHTEWLNGYQNYSGKYCL